MLGLGFGWKVVKFLFKLVVAAIVLIVGAITFMGYGGVFG